MQDRKLVFSHLFVFLLSVMCFSNFSQARLHQRTKNDKTIACGRPPLVKGHLDLLGLAKYPWTAALGYTRITAPEKPVEIRCVGSVISSRYVLTTATCSFPQKGYKLTEIRLGDWDVATEHDCMPTESSSLFCAPPHVTAGIDKIIIHPKYKRNDGFDIALIKLNLTLDFDFSKAWVAPICLPDSRFDHHSLINSSNAVLVSGWEFRTSYASQMALWIVPIEPDKNCRKFYAKRFKENSEVCGRSVCVLSGSPLIATLEPSGPLVQIGIVSYGVSPCGTTDFPDVYTSVADNRDWIDSQIQ